MNLPFRAVSPRAIGRVWLRYYSVFRKNLRFSAVTTLVEPLLFLGSFGLGLGALMATMQVEGVELSYRRFVFAGILGQTVLFQAFFESAYGGFVRMYYQKIFLAMAMTPITLDEVLWGELLWDATRATIACGAVLGIGVATGDFGLGGALAMVPVCFVTGLLFAGLGMLCAGRAVTIEHLSYPQFLFVFPMFLFCGVFFPLSQLPAGLQPVVEWLPLTAFLRIARCILLGLPFRVASVLVLLAWLAVLLHLGPAQMRRRLVK